MAIVRLGLRRTDVGQSAGKQAQHEPDVSARSHSAYAYGLGAYYGGNLK